LIGSRTGHASVIRSKRLDLESGLLASGDRKQDFVGLYKNYQLRYLIVLQTVDLNHPLAGKDLALSAVVGKVETKDVERGGTGVDWMEG
jgi:hypothetical protein